MSTQLPERVDVDVSAPVHASRAVALEETEADVPMDGGAMNTHVGGGFGERHQSVAHGLDSIGPVPRWRYTCGSEVRAGE